MDTATELRMEREALARADLGIRKGKERVLRQEQLIVVLAGKGHDIREAGRLLRLLGQTLANWRDHRVLIVDRIAYLEVRSGLRPASGGACRPGGGFAPAEDGGRGPELTPHGAHPPRRR